MLEFSNALPSQFFFPIPLSSALNDRIHAMNLNLQNKTVFITGASSGVGAAAAQIFSQEGADVVVSYGKNDTGAEQTAQLVHENGRRAWFCPMDVSDPDSVAGAVRSLPAEINGLDALVVCAGFSLHTDFTEITPEEWNRVLAVNLNGPFYILQALAPLLRDGASIVMVSSVSAQTGVAHQAHYAAAKAGLVNLTKSAARALAPRIRVNCVTPGITLTPMGRDTINALEDNYAKDKMLLQRFATPDEIARCIVFLASPANSFMTGATVDVNGGRNLR
jgi:3-oxoacyl-[acyl-carrier protein] reductase